MAISVTCNKCRRELDVPGGILFGPPSKQNYDGALEYSLKLHLCKTCCDEIITAILVNKDLS